MNISTKMATPCEFINVKPLNPLISRCQIKVCYVSEKPNRNKSIITKEVAREMANSLPGSPIVGYYNEIEGDFESHNRDIEFSDGKFIIKDLTKPYGFVDLSAKCWFQKFLDNGVEHEYLMTEGYLWTGQYPESKRIIEKGNNQSMELDENLISGEWTKDSNGEPQFFIINEAIISKLCILGENVEPCFEGAQISKVQFSFEDSFKKELFSMIQQLKEILDEGGAPMEENIIETSEIEFDKEEKEKEDEKESCPKCGKPLSECECEKDKEEEKEDKENKYNLDEIQEYVVLSNNYSLLNTQYEQLLNEYNLMKEEYEKLVEFKKSAEKKDKQEMIDSFYMLSEEDKKEVQENIDTYSLEDIEAKLSIICVRNKVSFDLETEETKADPTTYNLEDAEDDDTPAWIKAVQMVAKKDR